MKQLTDEIKNQPLQEMVQASENYNHITLTPEETESALREWRRRKHQQLVKQDYLDRLNIKTEYINYNADEWFYGAVTALKKNNPAFNIEVNNIKQILWWLCFYFTSDKRFEEAGYSLQKGICLGGRIGCGKSTLMRVFTINQRLSYNFVECLKVADEYQQDGIKAMDKYFDNSENTFIKIRTGNAEVGYCFDDLGTEDYKKNYGNEVNVLAAILTRRYSKVDKHSTHLTTNLTADQIGEYYGPRVRSRMREMFNVIDFPADAIDLRK
jgi:DNA replication protein DnaC